MDLFDTISAQIKDAMLAKDRVRLEALRGIKKEFLEARSLPGAGGTLSDDAAVKILVKMAKQRRESAEIYSQNGRQEMAAQTAFRRGTDCRIAKNYCPDRSLVG